MKVFNLLVLSACLALCACSMQPDVSVQTNEHGTQWQWDKGTIVVETPERSVGQESVIRLVLPKMEVVRVGFVGLEMLGSDAVERFTHIPGIQIVALCDNDYSHADNCQEYLKMASLPKAAIYSGEKGYEDLCKRDDIDLVYIAADWIHYFLVAKCALENGKNVVIEAPSAMTLNECWDLVNMSEMARKYCMIYPFPGYTLNVKAGSHKGVDSIMDSRLVYCLQNGLPLDMDVYDLVKWNKIRNSKPVYATPENEAATMEKAKAFTAKLKVQGAKEWSAE